MGSEMKEKTQQHCLPYLLKKNCGQKDHKARERGEKSLTLVPTGLSHYYENLTTDISLYHSSRKAEALGMRYSQKEVRRGSIHLSFLPLSHPPSLTGLLSNSFRKPREPAFPWNLPK